jgi:hypothetical protein
MTRVLPLPLPSFLLTPISLTLPFPVPSSTATTPPNCLAPHEKIRLTGDDQSKPKRITLLQEIDEEA